MGANTALGAAGARAAFQAAAGTAGTAGTVRGVRAVDGARHATAATATGAFFYGAAASVAPLVTPRPKYEKVGSAASMRSIIRAVEAKKGVPYDLISWNCNHFANHLCSVLLSEA